MNFYERLDLKFQDYDENEKNKEMMNKILEKDKSLFFVNLIKEKKT